MKVEEIYYKITLVMLIINIKAVYNIKISS